MAVQVETQGQLQEFLSILSRRRWQVLLPAAIVIAIGVFFAVITPKKYLVKTQVEVRPTALMGNKDAANAPFQIKSKARLKKVVEGMQNQEYLAMDPEAQNDFMDAMEDDIKVVPTQATTQGTTFVDISYVHTQREWALDFLRALRDDWKEDVLERDRRKAASEEATLLEEKTKLERKVAAEEQLLTELRRRHGLSATQPVPGSAMTRNEDPIFARLEENEAERDRIERELARTIVEIASLQGRYDDLPPKLYEAEEKAGGVGNQSELSEIDLRIIDLEGQLRNLRPIHPRFERIRDEMRQLEAKREQVQRMVTRSEVRETETPNPALAPLKKEIDQLSTKRATMAADVEKLKADIQRDRLRVDELQDVRREERERVNEIARLLEVLTDTEKLHQSKAAEVEMRNSPLQNPFDITAEVHGPSKPTEPNPWLIIAFAALAGLAMGIGTAVVGEFSRSCFRSVGEISRVMAMPVLGTIQSIVTERERAVLRARRTTVGVVCLLVVLGISFVTWSWAYNARLLGQDLLDAIEALRSGLK